MNTQQKSLPEQDHRVDQTTSPAVMLQWAQRTPVIGNNLTTKQFLFMLALAFAIVQGIFSAIGYSTTGNLFLLPWQASLVLGGVVLVLLLFTIVVVYRNRYTLEFLLDETGVRYRMGSRERKINRAVTMAGAVTQSARVTGGGLGASAGESGAVRWENFSRARINQATMRIVLYRSWFPVMELFCPQELFPHIRELTP